MSEICSRVLAGDIFESNVVIVLVAQSYPILCDAWTVAHQALLFMGFSRQEYWRIAMS